MCNDRTQGVIGKLFDQLDTWRHLPSYQLERRADIFFSLYLQEVLEDNKVGLGIPIDDRLIPEFPVRIGTINARSSDEQQDVGSVVTVDTSANRRGPSSEQSYKIDYVAFSADKSKVILIELKTDAASHLPEQARYLNACQTHGFHDLLTGIKQLFLATNSKRKYFRLLVQLEEMELITGLKPLREVMNCNTLRGASVAAEMIEPNPKLEIKECLIVYIQPTKEPRPENSAVKVISFDDFRSVVQMHGDLISQRFAASLDAWSKLSPDSAPQR